MSGRAAIPKYVVETNEYGRCGFNEPMIWQKTWGRPTDENLKKFVEQMNKSTKPGGCNDHLKNCIIANAKIRHNCRDGAVIATYRGPSFMVMD